eukprot:765518-Hanusia_phi.AAC.15
MKYTGTENIRRGTSQIGFCSTRVLGNSGGTAPTRTTPHLLQKLTVLHRRCTGSSTGCVGPGLYELPKTRAVRSAKGRGPGAGGVLPVTTEPRSVPYGPTVAGTDPPSTATVRPSASLA